MSDEENMKIQAKQVRRWSQFVQIHSKL